MRRLLTFAALGLLFYGTAAQADVIPFGWQNWSSEKKEEWRKHKERSWAMRQEANFMSDLKEGIEKAWYPPRDQATKKVTVMFKVHRDGSISELRIQNSSGVASVDEAALRATTFAAPFQQLPVGFPEPSSVEFSFDYVAGCSAKVVSKVTTQASPSYKFTSTSPEDKERKPKEWQSINSGNSPFMSDLQRRIKRAWITPTGYETTKVSVVFKVNRIGQIDELRIQNSSGVDIVDRAALSAVRGAAPFDRSIGGPPESAYVEFSFDYVAGCSAKIVSTDGMTDVSNTAVNSYKPYATYNSNDTSKVYAKDASNTAPNANRKAKNVAQQVQGTISAERLQY